MPEAKAPAIEIAIEMLNHHIPGFTHSEEFAKRLVEALLAEVMDEATDHLCTLEDPELITLRDKLLEKSIALARSRFTLEDSPAEILTKCKLEGEQRGYYDAYCLADAIITESAERCRAALKAGVAKYFDGVDKI